MAKYPFRSYWVGALIALALAGGGTYFWHHRLTNHSLAKSPSVAMSGSGAHRHVSHTNRVVRKGSMRKNAVRENRVPSGSSSSMSVVGEHSPAASLALDKIQNALDTDNAASILATVKPYLNSTNTEVKVAAINALAFTGPAGFDSLLSFLTDKDPEVYRAAMDAWQVEVQNLDASAGKTQLLDAVGTLATETLDDEALNDVIMAMNDTEDRTAVLMLEEWLRHTDDLPKVNILVDEITFRTQGDIESEDPVVRKTKALQLSQEFANRPSEAE